MIQKLLTDSGSNQTLIWRHFADLKKGIVDFGYTDRHNPEVVIFDLSPRMMRIDIFQDNAR